MKAIDLLNKIANGEKLPLKIKWKGVVFQYKEFKHILDLIKEVEEWKKFFRLKNNKNTKIWQWGRKWVIFTMLDKLMLMKKS